MYGLELLLKNQVPQAGLLVQFINQFVECIEQRVLLPFHVEELLLLDFKLPLNLKVLLLALLDLFVDQHELVFDFFVLNGINLQFLAPGNRCIVGTFDISVAISLVPQISLEAIVIFPCIGQVILQLPYDVQVGVCDLSVVVLDGLVLLRMFGGQLVDSDIFLALNHVDCVFTALLHVRPEQEHFVLKV